MLSDDFVSRLPLFVGLPILLGIAIMTIGMVNNTTQDTVFTDTQDGTVLSAILITEGSNGFTGNLDNDDWFGDSIENLGDVDGDGIIDLAVSAPMDDDGNTDFGAVWILFMNADGTVKGQQKISDTAGNFTHTFTGTSDYFLGTGMSALGDLDDDGIPDLAIGGQGDDTDASNQGTIFITYLNANGTVKNYHRIGGGVGGFNGSLSPVDSFGSSIELISDLDGNGHREIAVGAETANTVKGEFWILFMNSTEHVIDQQQITEGVGGFNETLGIPSFFGSAIADIGDLDLDGIGDLAVGHILDDEATGSWEGAIYIMFMNTDGTVRDYQKINDVQGNLPVSIGADSDFGIGIDLVGDLNNDGIQDIIVGAWTSEHAGIVNDGEYNIIYLKRDGTVKNAVKVFDDSGHGLPSLGQQSHFGSDIEFLGDFNSDGSKDWAVGAPEASSDIGKFYIIYGQQSADGWESIQNTTSNTSQSGSSLLIIIILVLAAVMIIGAVKLL